MSSSERFDVGLTSEDVFVLADESLEAVVVHAVRADVELVLSAQSAVDLALALIGATARLRGYDADLAELLRLQEGHA